MTALTATATSNATEAQLRSVLLLDGVVTVAVGLFALLGPSWYAGPDWLARAFGAAFVLAGTDALLLGRATGRRLQVGARVIAVLAFAWTVTALVLTASVDMEASGREVLVVTGLGTLAFGIVETRLIRRLG